MKFIKLRDFPALFVLFTAAVASVLLGCGGGGGGGGAGIGGGAVAPQGKAPESLIAGDIFQFAGEYERVELDGEPWSGNISKTLNITSPTSGDSASMGVGASPSAVSNLTYTRSGNLNGGKIVATNYPYVGALASSQRGTVEIELVFLTTTSGTFIEAAVDSPTVYSGSGTFTFSRTIVVTGN